MAKSKEEIRDESRELPEWLKRARAVRTVDRPCRLGVNVSRDVMRRLKAVKAYEGVDYGQVIEGLVFTVVQGYSISLRGSGEKEEAA